MLPISILAYLVITLLIGTFASRLVKSSSDFVLAGRSLPLFLTTSALFATWFGSETILGASSEFVKHGLIGVIEDPFGGALCLFLFGLLYARKLYNLNILTISDLFLQRFGKRAEMISALFLIPTYFGYIAAQLVALGIIINVVSGIPLFWAITGSAVVVTSYTFLGGMWAISIADFIQSIIIVVGLLILTFLLGNQAGGFQEVIQTVPEGFFRFIPENKPLAWFNYIAAWMVLGLGSIPSQDIFQRSMSSKSANVAVNSAFLSSGLYLLLGLLPLFIGLCSKILYPELLLEDEQHILPMMVLGHTPIWVQVLFFGALLSAIMSTASAAILAPASILSENLIRPAWKHKLSDKHFLLILRLSVLVMAFLATIMANLRSNIYELVGESSALTLVSLFAPMTAALYWKKASSFGAILSMVSGILTWVIFELVWLSDFPSLIAGLLVSSLSLAIGSYIRPDK
jgi:solute:Na+ symporter, SSS family